MITFYLTRWVGFWVFAEWLSTCVGLEQCLSPFSNTWVRPSSPRVNVISQKLKRENLDFCFLGLTRRIICSFGEEILHPFDCPNLFQTTSRCLKRFFSSLEKLETRFFAHLNIFWMIRDILCYLWDTLVLLCGLIKKIVLLYGTFCCSKNFSTYLRDLRVLFRSYFCSIYFSIRNSKKLCNQESEFFTYSNFLNQ